MIIFTFYLGDSCIKWNLPSIARFPQVCISFKAEIKRLSSFANSCTSLKTPLFLFFVLFSSKPRVPNTIWWSSGKTTLSHADLELASTSFRPYSLGCSSHKWRLRATLKGPGVQLPLTECHSETEDGLRHNNCTHQGFLTRSLKCAETFLASYIQSSCSIFPGVF